MANLIPAIEWDDLALVGNTTNGNPTITSIASTTDVVVGQVVYGTGVPYNSRVVSKTGTTITLDQNATATGSSIALTLYYRYDFDYPPISDEGEQYKANQKVLTALSGIQQTQLDHIEATRSLRFGFVTKTDRDTLRDDFMVDWAFRGYTFRYFEDQDVNTAIVYQNDTPDYKQRRRVKKYPDFLYELDFKFRRVVS